MKFGLGTAILAGFLGTFALTVMIYAAPLILLPTVDILGLLGSFLFSKTVPKILLGAFLHLGLGLTFSFLYARAWSLGVGAPTWRVALIFGLGHGLVAIATLQILYALLPTPPPIYMTGGKSLALLLGHLAYAQVVAAALSTDARLRAA